MTEPIPSPIMLYVRLHEASAALARQIDLLAQHEPDLALPVDVAWVHLDDLIEQLPASLAQEARVQEEEPHG